MRRLVEIKVPCPLPVTAMLRHLPQSIVVHCSKNGEQPLGCSHTPTYWADKRKASMFIGSLFMLLSKGNKCGLAYVMTQTGLIVPYACRGTPKVLAFPNSLCIGCLGEGVGEAMMTMCIARIPPHCTIIRKAPSQSLMPPKPNIVNIAESLLGLLIEHEWFLTGMWVISKH